MLYLKNDSKGNLVYFCRNCGEVNKNVKINKCVYNIKYFHDDYVHKYSNNKQLINDPTLPRLKNIKCINPECVTNKFFGKYLIVDTNSELDKSLFIDNLNKEIPDMLEDSEILVGMADVEKNGIFVLSLNIKNKKELNEKLKAVRNYIDKKSSFDVSNVITSTQDVIFIKYDNVNMKYLYLCTNCNTSWKNK